MQPCALDRFFNDPVHTVALLMLFAGVAIAHWRMRFLLFVGRREKMELLLPAFVVYLWTQRLKRTPAQQLLRNELVRSCLQLMFISVVIVLLAKLQPQSAAQIKTLLLLSGFATLFYFVQAVEEIGKFWEYHQLADVPMGPSSKRAIRTSAKRYLVAWAVLLGLVALSSYLLSSFFLVGAILGVCYHAGRTLMLYRYEERFVRRHTRE